MEENATNKFDNNSVANEGENRTVPVLATLNLLSYMKLLLTAVEACISQYALCMTVH